MLGEHGQQISRLVRSTSTPLTRAHRAGVSTSDGLSVMGLFEEPLMVSEENAALAPLQRSTLGASLTTTTRGEAGMESMPGPDHRVSDW